MQTVILDYENAKVIVWNHEDFWDMEMLEEEIYKKFQLKSSSIEWMSAENISLEYVS